MRSEEEIKERIAEINKKIKTYKKRIAERKNKPCFFDESKRIQYFEDEITLHEEMKSQLIWVLEKGE